MDLIFVVLLVVLVLAAVLYWRFFMKKKSGGSKTKVDMPMSEESSDAGTDAGADTVVSEAPQSDVSDNVEMDSANDDGMGGEDLMSDDEEVK